MRRRVPDPLNVEHIVQEVFYELVEDNQLLMPIDETSGNNAFSDRELGWNSRLLSAIGNSNTNALLSLLCLCYFIPRNDLAFGTLINGHCSLNTRVARKLLFSLFGSSSKPVLLFDSTSESSLLTQT